MAMLVAGDRCQFARMGTTAEVLCRRIELYRRILRDGVDAATSLHYLYEIMALEDELAELLRAAQQKPATGSVLRF